jgi:uncharacterized protein YndB with AHSA1/START domain
VKEASRELLASRAEVWAFFAEPNHLTDWWPGMLGVVPDRRGFAPGARWTVRVRTHNVFTGRGVRESLLLIQAVDLYERWAWHLISGKLDVELRLEARGDRTLVTCLASGRGAQPELALKRLYDLLQTASTL